MKTAYDQLFGSVKNVTEAKEELNNVIELTDEQVYYEYYAWMKLKEATDEYIRGLASGEVENALGNIGLKSAKMFLDFDVNGKSTYDKLIEGADTFGEKFAITFQAVGDVTQEVFSIMAQNSSAYFDGLREQAEAQYEYQLQFANGNAEAERQLQEDLAKRKREIANQEAKAKREQTIFNILMNTAQGVTAALASVPPNPILAGIVGALGLAQLAMASSVKIPQYYKGRNNGGAELAITDERGAELHTDKQGNIKDWGSNKGARYKWLDEGDVIYTANETLKFQKAFSDSVSTPKPKFTSETHTTVIREQVPTQNVAVNIDKNGIRTTITEISKTAEVHNNYYRIKGFKA